jgi:hypothetical protein
MTLSSAVLRSIPLLLPVWVALAIPHPAPLRLADRLCGLVFKVKP